MLHQLTLVPRVEKSVSYRAGQITVLAYSLIAEFEFSIGKIPDGVITTSIKLSLAVPNHI
jgi:hypothetical protein